jgi:hypothetical protein
MSALSACRAHAPVIGWKCSLHPEECKNDDPARTLIFALLFCALVGGAACSSTKSADQSSDPGASASATSDAAAVTGPASTSGAQSTADADAGAGAAAGNGDSNSNGDDPCQKLALSDVSLSSARRSPLRKTTICSARQRAAVSITPDDHTSFEVMTVTGAQAARYYDGTLPQVGGATAKAVPGIGDKAVRGAEDVQVHALKGNVFCMFSAGKDARDSLKGFESCAGKPIPDNLAGPEAEKLAAICTKLFN